MSYVFYKNTGMGGVSEDQEVVAAQKDLDHWTNIGNVDKKVEARNRLTEAKRAKAAADALAQALATSNTPTYSVAPGSNPGKVSTTAFPAVSPPASKPGITKDPAKNDKEHPTKATLAPKQGFISSIKDRVVGIVKGQDAPSAVKAEYVSGTKNIYTPSEFRTSPVVSAPTLPPDNSTKYIIAAGVGLTLIIGTVFLMKKK